MNTPLRELLDLYGLSPRGTSKAWDSVEERLGTGLPRDYKELVEAFGAGRFDAHIWLLEPQCPNQAYDLEFDNDGRMDDLEDFWEMGEEKPAELDEAGSRLVSWGSTPSGEVLYWLVRPHQDPDRWTVMVNESRGPRWEHFETDCTEFLSGILTGRLRSRILASRLPAAEHEFRPVAAG
ncbi:SMI1/KNR4 family protein [Streptomyces sp900105755]|uniref:SMI1/KNR4 family protein n=1 Tax=Streptomyces sp. 900105755 TaxID=3154389 RepID=UPI00332B9501